MRHRRHVPVITSQNTDFTLFRKNGSLRKGNGSAAHTGPKVFSTRLVGIISWSRIKRNTRRPWHYQRTHKGRSAALITAFSFGESRTSEERIKRSTLPGRGKGCRSTRLE
jgi:hypothetical protein